MKKIIFFAAIFFIGFQIVYSQEDTLSSPSETDTVYQSLLTSLEDTDLSFLWAGKMSQSNRLGYIGEDFQRLEVRFISVIKNIDNPYEYFLYGKTRVSGTICEFQGSLHITETGYLEDESEDASDFKRAYIAGDYVLFEDQACLHSGVFRGGFFSGIYLDEELQIYYDDINIDEEDFINNEFFGEWESYYPYDVKPANWGDFRIPNSTGLDVGQESFKPSFLYLENGWKGFEKERGSEEEGEVWW